MGVKTLFFLLAFPVSLFIISLGFYFFWNWVKILLLLNRELIESNLDSYWEFKKMSHRAQEELKNFAKKMFGSLIIIGITVISFTILYKLFY